MAGKKTMFEWYVLNNSWYDTKKFEGYPYTGGKIKPFNIFANGPLLEETRKLCDRYKRYNMSFDDFVEELRSLVLWQEWARCEYEILVGDLFDGKQYKIDCYQQVLPNIRILAKYVLQTYYPRLDTRGLK